MPQHQNITAIILAGGQAKRMQGVDKGLQPLAGKPLIQWALTRLQPQVDNMIISANRNQTIYQQWGYPVIADAPPYIQLGPLSGIATIIASQAADYYLIAPCDCPCLPMDLVHRLSQQQAPACAHDGTRLQPLFSLLPSSSLTRLQDYLASGQRQMQRWLFDEQVNIVDFSDQADAFININTQDQRQQMEQRLCQQ